VNLYLTGKMMASANSKPVGEDGVSVGFSDKKAEYHNETGAGKSKVLRRMLPTRRGEVFSRTVMQKVMKVLQTDVIRLVLSRGK
jgi:hypothetical protein